MKIEKIELLKRERKLPVQRANVSLGLLFSVYLWETMGRLGKTDTDIFTKKKHFFPEHPAFDCRGFCP